MLTWDIFGKVLDKLDRKEGLEPTVFSEKGQGTDSCFSTGSLTLDLILGGGIPFGRFVVFSGQESSGKSTILYTALITLLTDKRFSDTLILFFDHEGTLTMDYLVAISGIPYQKLSRLFKERVRYYEPDVGDQSFRILHKALKLCPRIVQSKDGYEAIYPAKLPKDLIKNLLDVYKDKYDKKMFQKTGEIRIPVSKPYPTLVAFIDSLAAMFPEAMDERMDSNKPADQAAMFSKWFRAIKPLLASRKATLLSANQIRMRPMVMFGSPVYETGGEALKFYSDIRAMVNACSVPHGKGQIEQEGENEYRYSKVVVKKNKVFIPYREAHIRVWIKDTEGNSRGICPYWDTLTYLKLTGQIVKSKGKYKIKGLPGFEGVEFTEELVFCKQPVSKASKKASKKKKQKKTKNLRDVCFEQLRSKMAFELYFRKEKS